MVSRRSFLVSSAVTLALGRAALAAAATSDPGFKLFDAHCHLRTDDTVRYPRGTAANGQGRPPGSPGGPPAPSGPSPSVEAVLGWMDANGVAGGAAVQHRGSYGFDNRYILDSADAHRDRLVPVCVLDAESADTPAQIRAYVQQHGLAGVRLTGMRAEGGGFPWLSSTAAQATWAVANEFGLVLDLMTSPPGEMTDAIDEYLRLAKRFPKVRLVLDHVAWPRAEGAPDFGIDAAIRSLAAQRNIYYKFTTINLDTLSAAGIAAPPMLRHVVDVFGADHVLWGSDIGNTPGPYSSMVERIHAAASGLTAAQRRAVLHDTGKRVYARGGSLARA
ncbi:MAG TPA: amidohydrolase family protein [Steroidobacteraceae bacterium]|nr:amidohydrolase family protein [Steroidobacteraceae bacterium]